MFVFCLHDRKCVISWNPKLVIYEHITLLGRNFKSMVRLAIKGFVLMILIGLAGNLQAQSIYDLRNLSAEDWLSMSTDERMNALATAYKHSPNQTFLGKFGQNYDLSKKWGYEFYEMDDRYQNYSFRGFENYNVLEERRQRWSYNEFGDRIPRMKQTFTLWNENYGDAGSYAVTKPTDTDDFINAIATEGVDGIWVAKEGTDDWAASAIYAGALRTKYTPLSLSIPNIDGLRLDFQSANNSISIVNSALLGSINDRNGAMLRAGQFRRKLGALTLGATYANQYSVQNNRYNGDTWNGTVGNYVPTPMVLAVRVRDDSPNDGEGGPKVSDVRIKINGVLRDDIKPMAFLDDLTREKTTALIKDTDRAYINPSSGFENGKPTYDFLVLDASMPKYADYIYLTDMARGVNTASIYKKYDVELGKSYYKVVDPSLPVQVNGTQYVVYWFDISSISDVVKRAEAELTVSNDYRVESTMVYTTSTTNGHDTDGSSPNNWYKATYWRTEEQAEGNIKDGSNTKRVSIDFGVMVASMMYGMDMDFNYRGLKIKGEFITNTQHYMFPDASPGTGFPLSSVSGQTEREGHRWTVIDNSYYLTTNKDWKQFGVAGEVFKMGKFYRPYFDYSYSATRGFNSRNYTIRYPFIEDNDDDDQYPDTMNRQRAMAYRIFGSEDPDGVFPGNDADNDGIADNNKNNNSTPDYEEPFLMFDVDPDQYVFGNDYNNNSIPDFREDDMKMDTPYDLDRKGHHIYFRYSPIESVNMFVGSMRTKGIGLDTRTNDDYLKLQMNYNVFNIGKLYAEFRHEDIQDNVSDDYIQVSTKMRTDYLMMGITASLARFSRELFYDELEYRNSTVDRIFLDSKIRALPSLTLENHLKFERNHQIEGVCYDGVYQPDQDIGTVAMVNKIVYTKKIGNWQISPGIKYRFYKKDRSESVRANDFYLTRIPLVMFKYIISPRTDIMFGMQGLPGLEFNFKDYVQSMNDYNQKTYTLQLQNRTTYFGYQIWAATGIRVDELVYEDDLRSFEDYKSSTLFVKIFLGY